MTPPSRTRTALLAVGLLLAGVAFAAGLAVLTTSIASPQIGLRGTPGVLSPADTVARTTPTGTEPARTVRSTSTATTRTSDDDPPPASTPRPSATAPPVATAEPDDDVGDDGPDDDDSGQGRGRGRGRGGDDEDDD